MLRNLLKGANLYMKDNNKADLINLIDDDGKSHDFEIVDEAEIEGEYYAALMPYIENADEITEDDCEVYLFKIVEEKGEEMFVNIENDDEYEAVYKVFEERFENMMYDDEEE